jgi:hypothetical protein
MTSPARSKPGEIPGAGRRRDVDTRVVIWGAGVMRMTDSRWPVKAMQFLCTKDSLSLVDKIYVEFGFTY